MSRSYCTPSVPKHSTSCYTTKLLRRIVKEEKQHAKDTGKQLKLRPYTRRGGRRGNHDHRYKAGLLATVKEQLGRNETKWPSSKALSRNLQYQLKRRVFPTLVKGPQGWFDDADIADKLQQYEDDHRRHFANFGPMRPPLLISYLHRPRFVQKITNGAPKIMRWAIAANTSAGRYGSHWVVFYVDHRQKSLEYFDSMGRNPVPALRPAWERLKALFKGYHIHINKTRHQRQANQCGMYVVYYVVQRLTGRRARDINKTPIYDMKMCKKRTQYYIVPKKRIG